MTKHAAKPTKMKPFHLLEEWGELRDYTKLNTTDGKTKFKIRWTELGAPVDHI